MIDLSMRNRLATPAITHWILGQHSEGEPERRLKPNCSQATMALCSVKTGRPTRGLSTFRVLIYQLGQSSELPRIATVLSQLQRYMRARSITADSQASDISHVHGSVEMCNFV